MKNRRLTIGLLLFVNFLMLAVTVVPHHHHNGVPCVRSLFEEQTEHHGNASPDSNHCGDDCITKLEFRETSQQDQQALSVSPFLVELEWILPDYAGLNEGVPLLYAPLSDHFRSILFASSLGLRAPPVSFLS